MKKILEYLHEQYISSEKWKSHIEESTGFVPGPALERVMDAAIDIYCELFDPSIEEYEAFCNMGFEAFWNKYGKEMEIKNAE